MKNLLLMLTILAFAAVSCSQKESAGSPDTDAPEQTVKDKASITFNNNDFYDASGTFLESKAKEAIISLMKYHGYPIFPGIEESLWVSDYGTGQYTKLGLAANMFKNNEEDRYMLMDLFLLPGQMLPEHWHLDGETNPAKREGWLIRHGKSYVVGIGADNLNDFPQVKVPDVHMNGSVTTKHVVEADPGIFVSLAEVYSRHWQFGGPEGVILTEVANVHTDAAVRHSDEAINDHFLGK
jgi:D-lyxose ketol-isomerase